MEFTLEIPKSGDICQLCKKDVERSIQKKLANLFKLMFLEQEQAKAKYKKCKLLSKYYATFEKALKLVKLSVDKVPNQLGNRKEKNDLIQEALHMQCLVGGEDEVDKDEEKFTLDKEFICEKYLKDQFPCCEECYGAIMTFKKRMDNSQNIQAKALADLNKVIRTNQQITEDKEDENLSRLGYLPDLPQEMWEIILSPLITLNDLRASANSFSGWKKIISDRKDYWLFPAMIFPQLFEYLKAKDVLNCRVVCSQWCQGVDEFLEGQNHLAPYTDGKSYWEVTRKVRLIKGFVENSPTSLLLPYTLGRSRRSFRYWHGRRQDINMSGRPSLLHHKGFFEDIGNFDNHVPRRNNRSALIGRALNISMMTSLLHSFPQIGHHIWYLNLSYGDQKISCAQLMGFLCSVVKCFPNLRQLCVSAPEISPCDTFIALKDHGEITFPIFASPVDGPPLKTLQLRLNATRCYGIDDLLVKKFARGLGRLEVESWGSKALPPTCNWASLNWTNLIELHISSTDKIYREYNNGVVSLIEPLAAAVPTLRKLGLSYYWDPESPNLEYPRQLLNFLENFKMMRWLKLYFNDEKLRGMLLRGEEDCNWIVYEFWSNFTNIPNRVPASLPQIEILETNHRPLGKEFLLTFPNVKELVFSEVQGLNLPDIEEARELGICEDLKQVKRHDPICLDKLANFQFNYLRHHRHQFIEKVLPRQNEEMEREIYDSDVWKYCGSVQSIIFNGQLNSRKVYKSRRESATETSWIDVEGSRLFKSGLPNLVKLSLTFTPAGVGLGLFEEFSKAMATNHFPKMETLSISCDNFYIANEVGSGMGALLLPSLKCLELNFLPVFNQFLEGFPGLERLWISPDWIASWESVNDFHDAICYDELLDKETANKLSVTPFFNGEQQLRKNRLYQSQIWEILPALQKVNLTAQFTFTRQVQIRHQMDKVREEEDCIILSD